MTTNPQSKFRQQVRAFVLIWTGITFIMASLTFIAVYLTYDSITSAISPGLSGVAIPRAETPTRDPEAVLPLVTATPSLVPTLIVTPAPDSDVLEVAQAQLMPTPTLLPVDVSRFELGVQVQFSYDLMERWLDVASNQLSVNWVKQQVRWEDMEPQPGEYDWFFTDIYLPAARDQGVRVLISVVTAPDWAREEGVDLAQQGPPADPMAYANFITALLERYPGMVHAVEVWNEQNLDREWTSTGGLSAANYITLLRTTYQAIKEVDPGIIVVSGALAPTGLSDGVRAWDDFVYLDQLIAAGLLNYTDCVGAHHNGINVSPDYTWDTIPDDPSLTFRGPFDTPHHSWSFRSTLQTYADKIALAGGDQPLCVTEFGWPSAEGLEGIPQGFEFALDNSLEDQREYTVKALDFMRSGGYVRLAILWNLNYGAQAGWVADNDNVAYSIIGPDFVFRPVFDAVRDWNRTYEAEFGG